MYIGQDKNAPVNGDEEFNAMLLQRVFDPADQRHPRLLGGDVYDWFVHHQRFKVVRQAPMSSRSTATLPGRSTCCRPIP